MQYAIELFFDEAMEKRLFRYAERIAEETLSTKYLEWKTRPHITLACFNDVDEKVCAQRLQRFAQKQQKLPAYIGSLGMFPDTKTIFAAPIMTSAMYQLQREIHDCLSDFDTSGWEWYLPDRWVPHCGLALMNEDPEGAYYKACDLVVRSFEKVNGTFDSIGLVKISFPVEEIYVTELKGELSCRKHLLY